MTGDLSKLSAALDELAHAPAPPMDLDVARAREVGRRTLSRRRTLAWLGGVVAVAVAGVITASVQHFGGRPDPASTSTGNHPLITNASFGWLPDWIAGVSYGVGAHGDYAQARGTGDLPPYIWLSVSPTEQPTSPGPRGTERVTEPAEPVNGGSAYWITEKASDPTRDRLKAGGGDQILRWQVPSGQWAEMFAYYLPVNDARDVLLRIAADVTVADRPVPVPLRITSLPAHFVLEEVTLSRPMLPAVGTGTWEFQLFYRVNGESVTVDAEPAGTGRDKHDNSTCTTTDGIDVCVSMLPATDHSPAPPVPAALAAIGGQQGLLDRITVLGMDERNWTTRLYG